MKTNLIKAFWIKENQFWKNLFKLHKKFNVFLKIFPLGFPLVCFLSVISHICITSMSLLFECYLWLFNRSRYKININNMCE